MLKLRMIKIITTKTLVSFYVLIEIQQITASKCVLLESGKPCPQIEFFPGVIHYITPDMTNEVPRTMLASGTRAIFICDPDFALRGESQSFCFDGRWSTELPKCVSIWTGHALINAKYWHSKLK
ncbi:unnamed protein product [Wuchereria bancrofti]|uniref:Sushi domain-containing protein n=1 Tax=Wuchereria bancrofti TaxID=6293 RepID=A0A3P7E7Y1_WUCBA|nr:unnamed protein product [Wuchereria bancrofti]